MGMAQSSGDSLMDQETFVLLNQFPEGLDRRNEFKTLHMSGRCIYAWDDPEKARVQELIANKQLSPAQNRGLG